VLGCKRVKAMADQINAHGSRQVVKSVICCVRTALVDRSLPYPRIEARRAPDHEAVEPPASWIFRWIDHRALPR
jgi:hypothetical protein